MARVVRSKFAEFMKHLFILLMVLCEIGTDCAFPVSVIELRQIVR